jgi:isoleucyl-tRNA synthetase
MFVPEGWKDEGLAAKWARVREARSVATQSLEVARREGKIGSSLQAHVTLRLVDGDADLMSMPWDELLIVSSIGVRHVDNSARHDAVAAHASPEAGLMVGVLPTQAAVEVAPGAKCARCWRVLPEVGASAKHPALCLRCEDAVEALA